MPGTQVLCSAGPLALRHLPELLGREDGRDVANGRAMNCDGLRVANWRPQTAGPKALRYTNPFASHRVLHGVTRHYS